MKIKDLFEKNKGKIIEEYHKGVQHNFNTYEEYEKGFYTSLYGRASADYTVKNQSYCVGTKECECCTCGGDRRKCDFYPTK